MRLLPAYQGAIIESFILAQLQPKAAEALIGLVSSIHTVPFSTMTSTRNS